MVEQLETIAYLIARYAMLEEVFAHQSSAILKRFESLALQLYVEILMILALARKYFLKSMFRKCSKFTYLLLLISSQVNMFKAARTRE